MTTKPPNRPRKPRAKGTTTRNPAPQGAPAGLPPALQVMDTMLPDGTIVMQWVFTLPIDDAFADAMSKNLMARLAKKQQSADIVIPKLVLPKGVRG